MKQTKCHVNRSQWFDAGNFDCKGLCTVVWELSTTNFISYQMSSKSHNCSTGRQCTRIGRSFYYRTRQRMDRVLSQYDGTTATYRTISAIPQEEQSHKNTHEREEVITCTPCKKFRRRSKSPDLGFRIFFSENSLWNLFSCFGTNHHICPNQCCTVIHSWAWSELHFLRGLLWYWFCRKSESHPSLSQVKYKNNA